MIKACATAAVSALRTGTGYSSHSRTALRCCSGGGQGGSGGVDRHTETKGAMSSYLKNTSGGGSKPWLKNLKGQGQQQDKPHSQYFAADDPKAQARAKAKKAAAATGTGGVSEVSLSEDDVEDFTSKGRKSRRRRGGDDDDEEGKALDKQRQDRDDADPKRGISPTVSRVVSGESRV
jgi:hypothetical protein